LDKQVWRPLKKGEIFPDLGDVEECWVIKLRRGQSLIYLRERETLEIESGGKKKNLVSDNISTHYARTQKGKKPLFITEMIRGGLNFVNMQLKQFDGIMTESDKYLIERLVFVGHEMQSLLSFFKTVPTKSSFYVEELRTLTWLCNNIKKLEKGKIDKIDKIRLMSDGKFDEDSFPSFLSKLENALQTKKESLINNIRRLLREQKDLHSEYHSCADWCQGYLEMS